MNGIADETAEKHKKRDNAIFMLSLPRKLSKQMMFTLRVARHQEVFENYLLPQSWAMVYLLATDYETSQGMVYLSYKGTEKQEQLLIIL